MLVDTAIRFAVAAQFMDITEVAPCYPIMLSTLDKLWSSNVDVNAMAHFAMHTCTSSL